MAITLIRHGALEKKYQRRYVGHSNIAIDLNLFDEDKIKDLKNKIFDEVYSSDLKRCTLTLDKIGFSYKSNKALREVEFKEEFELKNFEEVSKLSSFKEEYLNSYLSWHEYICKESFISFEKRIKDFLNSLDLKKEILLCSHAGALKVMSAYLKNEEYEKCKSDFSYLHYERIETI